MRLPDGCNRVPVKALARIALWLSLATTFAWALDVGMRRDAAWTFARQYADAHGCHYDRGIPYRMVCP